MVQSCRGPPFRRVLLENEMATALKTTIERDRDVSSFLYEQIAKASTQGSIDIAYDFLRRAMMTSSYWVYHGGHHVAVHTLSKTNRVGNRVAIIVEVQS